MPPHQLRRVHLLQGPGEWDLPSSVPWKTDILEDIIAQSKLGTWHIVAIACEKAFPDSRQHQKFATPILWPLGPCNEHSLLYLQFWSASQPAQSEDSQILNRDAHSRQLTTANGASESEQAELASEDT